MIRGKNRVSSKVRLWICLSDCLRKFEVRRLGSHPNTQEFVFGGLGYVTFFIVSTTTHMCMCSSVCFVSCCWLFRCCLLYLSCSVYRKIRKFAAGGVFVQVQNSRLLGGSGIVMQVRSSGIIYDK